jgi:long-chain acyl-CoA synthetase
MSCHISFFSQDRVILLPSFTAESYVNACERHKCTTLTAVPPMIAMLLRDATRLRGKDFSSVSLVRMGSAPVTQALMDATRSIFPNAAIANAFGTTEAGSVVFAPHPEGKPTPLVSVGCKHPAVELRLIAEDGTDGDRGVLQIRCPALLSGYHNRERAFKKVITPDGYYATGDVFRKDADGFYFFEGRADDMFVSGGENIYPTDVENMLSRHPDISDAIVVPVDDDIKGKKPVAFVVRNKPALTEADVKKFCLENGPAYQHPRKVWFVDEFPLAGTNKVDRNALAKRAASNAAPVQTT